METKLVTAVKAAGGVCWKFTFPGTAGVPDRIVLLPPGRIALWRSKHLVKSSVRYNGFASEHFGGWASKPLCWTTRSRLEDTFGGSGSTLMACEQMNRICYMMELDENTPPSFSGAMLKTPGMPKACMSFVTDSRFRMRNWSRGRDEGRLMRCCYQTLIFNLHVRIQLILNRLCTVDILSIHSIRFHLLESWYNFFDICRICAYILQITHSRFLNLYG